MKKIRDMDYCLMIISDSYLKSQNCMYEVLEFIKDDNYINKILPIICKGTRIFSSVDRTYYTKYWQDEYKKIEHSSNGIDLLNQEDIIKNLKII
jgi:hypothetical protein